MKRKHWMLIISLLYPWIMIFSQSNKNKTGENQCLELIQYKDQIIESYMEDSTIQEHEKIIYEIYMDCCLETLARHCPCSDIAVLTLLNLGDLIAVLNDLDEEVNEYFNTCTNDQLGPYKFSDLGEQGHELLLDICHNFVAADSLSYQGIDQEKFCDCFTLKIMDRDITYSYFYHEFMDEIADPSSVDHNEIYLDCFYKSTIENDDHSIHDIQGPNALEEIEIFNLGSRKVKVMIGDHEKYFDLDTGAEKTVIPGEMAAKLQKDGLVRLYTGDDFFTLADGSRVLCKQLIIDDFHIGDFTVNNVMVVVPIEGEGSFLLGLSFLNKFKWSIDSERSLLVLERK